MRVPARLMYNLRRVVQTPVAFSNWPGLLRSMSRPSEAEELEFHVRRGPRVIAPNVPGARLPLYEQFVEDAYDINWLLGGVEPDQYVLDIGAHVGTFALNVASKFPRVRILCFEPSPSTFQYLQRNVAANGFAARVHCYQLALADVNGSMTLAVGEGASVHNGLTRAGERLVAGAQPQGNQVEVETRTFHDVIDRLSTSGTSAAAVKMDCEGGEYALVYASDPGDWNGIDRIVMEYHPVPGESWEELCSWLAAAGFEVTRRHEILPGLGTAWLQRRGL